MEQLPSEEKLDQETAELAPGTEPDNSTVYAPVHRESKPFNPKKDPPWPTWLYQGPSTAKRPIDRI